MFETANDLQRNHPAFSDTQPGGWQYLKDEASLIEEAQKGDLEAFNQLVLKYQDAVYRQAYWYLGDRAAAEDAAQEAFCRGYEKIYTYHGPSFRAWILRITTNYCLDQFRRQRIRKSISLDPIDEESPEYLPWMIDDRLSPEQSVEHGELSALIQKALLALSPEDRTPILLIDVQEMNYQDAAEFMRLPMNTFKSRLSRARVKLLRSIQPYLSTPTAPRGDIRQKPYPFAVNGTPTMKCV